MSPCSTGILFSVRNCEEPHIMIDEFTLYVRNVTGLGLRDGIYVGNSLHL